jgi:hypothetical protein
MVPETMEPLFFIFNFDNPNYASIFAATKRNDMSKDILENVFFLPYVGNKYESGLRLKEDGTIEAGTEENKGLKVMVLGESHYCGDECAECGLASTCKQNLCRKFTQDVITYYLNYLEGKEEFEPWMNTFTKFGKALTGKDERSKKIWDSVMFYNYVQRAINTARTSPISEDFKNSQKAFFEVLEAYKPDIIICWGKRLYNNLPNNGKQGEDIETEYEFIETWIYELKNSPKETIVIPIYHPSVGFDWSYWHKVIIYLF